MVDLNYLESQLKAIKFGNSRINKAEVRELQQVLLPEEKIYECVNGYYEGGMALLVATDIRVLLIDKKVMGFLNVDDLRFDMISDIDYSHKILGAQIRINCGMRNLIFKSINQQRLRKLIGHVQHRMSEIKREQSQHASGQKQHLEEINKQLQMYLLAQQQLLERQYNDKQPVTPLKPDPQLADYLFAQRLLEDFHQNGTQVPDTPLPSDLPPILSTGYVNKQPSVGTNQALLDEIAEAGKREVFGEVMSDSLSQANAVDELKQTAYTVAENASLMIAYSKLPYLLRTRRYRQPYSAKFIPKSAR